MEKGVVQGLIFDFDGVLCDSFKLLHETYLYLGKKFGLYFPEDEKEFKGYYSVDYIKMMEEKFGITDRVYINEICDEFARYMDGKADELKFFNGIEQTVEELSRKYALGIASSGTVKVMNKLLKKRRIHSLFCGKIVGYEDVQNIKPHPESILVCMQRMGIGPQDTTYVGDTTVDVMAARAAQLKRVVSVSYGFETFEDLASAKPDLILTKPEELRLL